MRSTTRPHIADPRGPELAAMLAALDPRTELIYRLALTGLSPHCSGDRAFEARTDELKRALARTASTYGVLLAEASRLADRLLADAMA